MNQPSDTDTADCCPSSADPRIARYFDSAVDGRVGAGPLPGMHAASTRLCEMLSDVAEVRPTVLELGCGPGAPSVSLLEGGASRVTGVDPSPVSIRAARRRALERGVADRAAFEVGDVAAVHLERHDWVILDRVLCCYGDLDRLIGRSIAAASVRYAFSVPVSNGWRGLVNRLVRLAENWTNAMRGRPCPGYGHDVRRIEGKLRAAGFARGRAAIAGLWYMAIFERPSAQARTQP
ncbi:MAG: class I SAM-dependent methyltransferase [Chloroflexi bacterium]|nr:class I SAM-dependent methyltransferase [Chloroflexota bacterium]